MDRREHLKLLLAGSLGAGLFLTTSCSDDDRRISEEIIAGAEREYREGRTPEELARDGKLRAGRFFSKHEMSTVKVLADMIIPADEISASATSAGVPEFIEFMMLDIPDFQVPMRGGLMWLDNRCRERLGKRFIECTTSERKRAVDEIAWPDEAGPDVEYGVRFFNRMRNLTATGFFTSEMGVVDLGYVGNRPNIWEGVPGEVLEKHGLSYDSKTLEETVRPEERDRIADWDEEGKLIR